MSTIHRFVGLQDRYDWEGVEIRAYGDEFQGVTRQVLIGPGDGAPNFAIRYFRLEPGTHSNLERHPHEHGVVILHGRARVQINDSFFEAGPLDTLFISGEDLHQFVPLGDEPLGFLCTIPAK
jgi:quercetin dioxygenase-like cupin family protein